MTRKRSILTLASVYIGTVIGAGFASGQEILQFFGIYGVFGIMGVCVSTILLSIIASNVLQKVYKERINNFEEWGSLYFSRDVFKWINLLLAFLLLTGYFVMLAGSGAIFEEHFGISRLYGIILMNTICFMVITFGVEGITRANNFIVPILIIVIFILAFFIIRKNQVIFSGLYNKTLLNIRKIGTNEINSINIGWLWSAIVYTCHNSIGAIVAMASLRPFIYDEASARYGGYLGGLGLGVLAILILLTILILYTDIMGLELPMVAAAHSLGNIVKKLYSGILLLAMFTTAIANGHGSILRFSFITGINEVWIRILICFISIPLATLGFKNLVSFSYPIFGYLGFIFILFVLLKREKKKIKRNFKTFREY